MAMYHGKQVVAPYRHVAWSLVTVADKTQLSDLIAQFYNFFMVEVFPMRCMRCLDWG